MAYIGGTKFEGPWLEKEEKKNIVHISALSLLSSNHFTKIEYYKSHRNNNNNNNKNKNNNWKETL